MILSVVSAVVFTAASKTYAFYGLHAARTVLTFEAKVEVSLKGVETLSQLKGPMREKALATIDAQIQHLMGVFQSISFFDAMGAT